MADETSAKDAEAQALTARLAGTGTPNTTISTSGEIPVEVKVDEFKIADETHALTVDDDIKETAKQANNPDAVEKALATERASARDARKQADELAAKVKKFEDRDKSEQEKLEERANGAESRADQAEQRLERYQIAVAKKLPAELADRLQGKNRKELEADADRLLELVKPDGRPVGDADAGKGAAGGGGGFNDAIRRGAAR